MIQHNVTVPVSVSLLCSQRGPGICSSKLPEDSSQIYCNVKRLTKTVQFIQLLIFNSGNINIGLSHRGQKLHRFLFLALPVFDSVGVDKMQSWWFMLATQDTMCSPATSLPIFMLKQLYPGLDTLFIITLRLSAVLSTRDDIESDVRYRHGMSQICHRYLQSIRILSSPDELRPNTAREKHFDAYNFMRVNSAATCLSLKSHCHPGTLKIRENGLFTPPEGFIDFDKRCH